ncbi:sensor histidine kinase [Celerinatantimonas sp. YJH-8]|uniref:sensor histidine kinase n=1 Tax=Celerinatantimonas sp. YJH-8 TaxID=3228714 RepID=UPI0038C7878B
MPFSDSLDFSTVLATIVHDIKNSLSLLNQSIESMAMDPEQTHKTRRELARLYYESSRINGTLVQLLAIFRSDQKMFGVNITHAFIADLLTDLFDRYRWLAQQQGIDILIEVDEDLTWHCDTELIQLLLGDIIVNSIRYCKKTIKIVAYNADNTLEIKINDDGDGYPDDIIDLAKLDKPSLSMLSQNRSGLGLYFAKLIARAHKNHSLCGSVILKNNGPLGGSEFILRLP